MADVLRVFQEYDPECAIGDHLNSKAEPIRSLAEYNWKSHTTVSYNISKALHLGTTPWIGNRIGNGTRLERKAEHLKELSSCYPINRRRKYSDSVAWI
eukprot:scaffold157988_cov45-Cyclotella_meneghiniana.AAC.4